MTASHPTGEVRQTFPRPEMNRWTWPLAASPFPATIRAKLTLPGWRAGLTANDQLRTVLPRRITDGRRRSQHSIGGKMRLVNSKILGASVAAASFSYPAAAATLDFDCDVPANRFSSVSAAIDGAPMILGTVQAAEMRSGANLPVAGGRLVSADGAPTVGFQLIAPSRKSSRFDIVLNLNRGNNPQRNVLGQIDATIAIPFSLSLTPTGRVSLKIGEKQFDAEFVPMPRSKAMIFCSTGQFKFTNLSLASNGR